MSVVEVRYLNQQEINDVVLDHLHPMDPLPAAL